MQIKFVFWLSFVSLQNENKMAKLRDYEEKLIVTAWYNKVGEKFTYWNIFCYMCQLNLNEHKKIQEKKFCVQNTE